jgi:hypothetical protein
MHRVIVDTAMLPSSAMCHHSVVSPKPQVLQVSLCMIINVTWVVVNQTYSSEHVRLALNSAQAQEGKAFMLHHASRW